MGANASYRWVSDQVLALPLRVESASPHVGFMNSRLLISCAFLCFVLCFNCEFNCFSAKVFFFFLFNWRNVCQYEQETDVWSRFYWRPSQTQVPKPWTTGLNRQLVEFIVRSSYVWCFWCEKSVRKDQFYLILYIQFYFQKLHGFIDVKHKEKLRRRIRAT